MRKHIWPLMLVVILMFSYTSAGAAAANPAVVTVTADPAEADGGTELVTSISGNPGMAAWMFDLTWDTSALTLDKPEDGPVKAGGPFSAGTLLYKRLENGIRVSWFNTTDIAQDGIMFSLRLKPTEAAAAGVYPITIVCSEVNTIDVKEESVPIRAIGCSVTLENENGNGETPSVSPSPAPSPEPSPVPSPTPTEPPSGDEEKAPLAFTDVAPDAYYYDAVGWALDKGVTSGTTPTTFSPDAPCTRGQTVTFLWRAAGSPEPWTQTNPFSDVQSGAYYYKAVLWAVEQGITNGTTATTFSPDAEVTRGQVVTFLYRAAGGPPAFGANPFTDVPRGEYFTDAVLWAVARGITNGTTATTFSPGQKCTRGQIVTFLYRAK